MKSLLVIAMLMIAGIAHAGNDAIKICHDYGELAVEVHDLHQIGKKRADHDLIKVDKDIKKSLEALAGDFQSAETFRDFVLNHCLRQAAKMN